jgi:peptidyl-prolyl cis-trans isomerase A (cyclophilin A)
MARTNVPDSATSQFFINVVDNLFLNSTSTQDGYAVFGSVIAGMEVVDLIKQVPVQSNGATAPEVSMPVTPLFIQWAYQLK